MGGKSAKLHSEPKSSLGFSFEIYTTTSEGGRHKNHKSKESLKSNEDGNIPSSKQCTDLSVVESSASKNEEESKGGGKSGDSE